MNEYDNEIESYRKLPGIKLNSDPIYWWRDHNNKFPILFLLMRRYLSI